MSRCTECGIEMHPADAAENEACRRCIGTLKKAKTKVRRLGARTPYDTRLDNLPADGSAAPLQIGERSDGFWIARSYGNYHPVK